jgi:hypothetical protein
LPNPLRQPRLVFAPASGWSITPDQLDTAIVWRKDDQSPTYQAFRSAAERVVGEKLLEAR